MTSKLRFLKTKMLTAAMKDKIAGHKDFQGHNHLVFGQPAWRVEAGFIYDWIEEIR